MYKYQPGDKVRIVDDMRYAGGRNSAGEMDRWAGEVMTIAEYGYYNEIHGEAYKMIEDFGAWYWFSDTMIAGLADPEINIDKNELMSFLGGKGM